MTYENGRRNENEKSLSVPLLSSKLPEEWIQTARLMGSNLKRRKMAMSRTTYGKSLLLFLWLTCTPPYKGIKCVTPTYVKGSHQRIMWPSFYALPLYVKWWWNIHTLQHWRWSLYFLVSLYNLAHLKHSNIADDSMTDECFQVRYPRGSTEPRKHKTTFKQKCAGFGRQRNWKNHFSSKITGCWRPQERICPRICIYRH